MPNGNIEGWLQQSQWVIHGTVEAAGAATMKAVPASPHTFVVRVDDILHGPSQFNDQRGQTITLYSARPDGLKSGQRAVFFTRSWLYGESLAVAEVGRLDAEPDRMREEIAAADQRLADRRLGERIAKAEFVIVGKVLDINPAPRGELRVVTEHDPDWWEAHIEVQSVEKGPPQERPKTVLYPNSTDEMWIDSPKFHKGQEGVWILQRNQREKGWPVLWVPGLTALDPLDFQPRQQLDRVRRLIRER